MGPPRRRDLAVLAILCAAVTGGCGSGGSALTTPTPPMVVATPGTTSPGGALAGFLNAAREQDQGQVPAWLATPADDNALTELLRVYSGAGTGRVFWDVAGVTVVGVASTGTGHADVTLSGDVDWCIGKAENDPTATCSVVKPLSGKPPHTYGAIEVDGEWKADIDIDASGGLDRNPEASPTAGATTATPSPT